MSDGDLSFFGWLATEVEVYVQPLRNAVDTGPEAITGFITKATGIDSEAASDALTEFANSTSSFVRTAPEAISDAGQVKDALQKILDAWAALQTAIPVTAVAGLVEYLTMQWLWNSVPAIYASLALVDVIDDQRSPGDRLRWNNVKYFWQPRKLLPEIYTWDTDFDADRFIRRLANLGKTLGAPIAIAAPSDNAVSDLGIVDTTGGGQPPNVIVVPLLQRMSAELWYAAGVNIVGLGGDPTNAAIVAVPFGLAT